MFHVLRILRPAQVMVLLGLLWPALSDPALAAEETQHSPSGQNKRLTPSFLPFSLELFGGGNGLDTSRFQHAGMVLHSASRLCHPGFRVKLMAGRGEYLYFSGDLPILAQTTVVEAMGGYQAVFGELTLKLYGGVSFERHALSTTDPHNELAGDNWGGKLAAESWLNLGRRGFAAFDATFSSIQGSYTTSGRLGYKFLGDWAAGPEIALTGSTQYRQLAAGGFIRGLAWGHEGRVSGGLARDYDGRQSPYFSVSLIKKF